MEKFFNYAIEKYEFLEPVFFCDHGISLFYIDSEIARSIMKVFLDREKPILPIHDGFVVKLQDEDLLFNIPLLLQNPKFLVGYDAEVI